MHWAEPVPVLLGAKTPTCSLWFVAVLWGSDASVYSAWSGSLPRPFPLALDQGEI